MGKLIKMPSSWPKLIRAEDHKKLLSDSALLNKAKIDSDLHKIRLKRLLMLIEDFIDIDIKLRRKEIAKTPYIELLREYHKEIEHFKKKVDGLAND